MEKACRAPFWDLWSNREERGALLETANQLKLLPPQLKRLHGDDGVRAALQNTRVASLLPPVGTEVFRCLTAASLWELQQHEAARTTRGKREENKEEAGKDQSKPAWDLEAGMTLPFFYGDPPPGRHRTPLEELDPHFKSQETFIVLGSGNIIHRFNTHPAFGHLSAANPLRKAAIWILSHCLFSFLILLTVLVNCVFMAVRLAYPEETQSWHMPLEIVFTVVYTLEFLVKVVSRGFCVGRFTFLRDPWNWLDLVVITMAYLGMFVHLDKLLALTTISRVLKVIPLIPGLRKSFHDFMKSTKSLAGVFVLAAFVLTVLTVLSLGLYMGSLRQKCVKWAAPGNWSNDWYHDSSDNNTDDVSFDFFHHVNLQENHHFLRGNLDPLLCGNSSDAGQCPTDCTCLKAGRNPNYGYTCFDNFGWSLLSILRLTTQDFFDNLMLLTLRANGKSQMLVFVFVFFPGAFLLVSLIVSKFVMATGEWLEARLAQASQKHKEFGQIVEVLKSREPEGEATSTTALSETQIDGNEKDRATGEAQACCACWAWLRQRLHSMVSNPFFDFVIVLCLIVNIIMMASEHYPMTHDFLNSLILSHLVFLFIYTVEMLVKMVALGPRNYFKVSWNLLEGTIVVAGLVDLCLSDIEGLYSIRIFHLLRIFRLARWWPHFRLLLKVMWASLRALRNPTLLLVTASFIFTLVGMQLFQKDYRSGVCRISQDCELPRWHMADFFHTFMLIVRTLRGQWIECLWDCMEVIGTVSGQPLCISFFMTVVVVGYLLILNLFLILLLTPLSSDSLLAVGMENNNNVHVAIALIKDAAGQGWSWIRVLTGNEDAVTEHQGDKRKDYMSLEVVPEDESKETEVMEEDEQTKAEDVQKQVNHEGRGTEEHRGDKLEDCCCQCCYRCCPLDVDTSQGGGKIWSNFRRACFVFAQSKCLDVFIIVIIFLSSIGMMLEDDYLLRIPVMQMVLNIADILFTCLFLMEMLIKWIGFGLKKYFSNPWCWLDFLILDVFLLFIMADKLEFSTLVTLRFLRSLRALGPLRLLSRFQGLKLVIQVLVQAIPTMFSGLLVAMTVWLVFSIMGSHMFAGTFHYCFNETSEEYFLPDSVENKSTCYSLISENYTEVRWKNTKYNFDNTVNGYVSLMHLAFSGDMYDIMYAAMDTTQVEMQPVYESNLYVYLYFVVFAISCFCTLNFFFRFIMASLQKAKMLGNHIFMTEEQLLLSRAMRRLFPWKTCKTVPRPQNQFQAWVFDLVTKPHFEMVMVAVICLNILCMAVESDDQSMLAVEVLYFLHFSFLIIFLLEFVIKVIALRKHYFQDYWNVADFIILVMCIAGVFISDLMEKYFIISFHGTPLIALLRLARVCRLLYVIHCTRGVRRLLMGFVMSFPALFNIVTVLLLFKVTFALFAMFNFAHVGQEPFVTEFNNFNTFRNSMTSMFVVSVSGGLSNLLYPMMITPPDCDPLKENPGLAMTGDCGQPGLAIAFFASYLTLSFLLAICLYLTVILGTYNSEDNEILSDEDLQMFYNTWMKYDLNASLFIPYSKLSEFCDSLQDPLRLSKPNAIKLIHMDLPLCIGDKVHFLDVLLSLIKQVSDDVTGMVSLKARVEKRFKINSTQEPYEPISSTLRRKREEVAAQVIQRAYRKGLRQNGEGKKAKVEPANGV